MNYDKATKNELIELLGIQDNKIAELLKQLEDQGIEIVTLKSNQDSQASGVEALSGQGDALANLQKLFDELSLEASGLKESKDILLEENLELRNNLEESEMIVEELKNQINQAEQKVEAITGTVAVNYKGKTYIAVIPRFKHNGISYRAEDLKNNPGLVADLIEDKLGVLRLAK